MAMFTVFWILFISLASSYYIIDNNKNVRVISQRSDCRFGKVEFYNGSSWGSLYDCTKSFVSSYAKEICETLGWERSITWYHANRLFNETNHSLISYTNIINCSATFSGDTCSYCMLIYNTTECIDLRDNYNIYVECNNLGSNHSSKSYKCYNNDDYVTHTDNNKYSSCSNRDVANLNDDPYGTVILIAIIIIIFGSIIAILIFISYSKYQEYQKQKKENIYFNNNKNKFNNNNKKKNIQQENLKRHRGFVKGSQELQLQPINRKSINNNKLNDNYVPPSQPMFIYQTRQIPPNDDKNKDVSGYDMEEIIPTLSVNRSTSSDKYGLITNKDEEEEEEEDQISDLDDANNSVK